MLQTLYILFSLIEHSWLDIFSLHNCLLIFLSLYKTLAPLTAKYFYFKKEKLIPVLAHQLVLSHDKTLPIILWLSSFLNPVTMFGDVPNFWRYESCPFHQSFHFCSDILPRAAQDYKVVYVFYYIFILYFYCI